MTDAVHLNGGKIFVQLMHTGRISHHLNMPQGAEILAPSAVKPAGQMWTDHYSRSIENRCRFVLEVVSEVAEQIGKEKTAIRLSPYGVASDMSPYPEIDATYSYLAEQLNKAGIVYIHIVDHSAMGAPEVPADMKKRIRGIFKNTIILSGGYDLERVENGFDL